MREFAQWLAQTWPSLSIATRPWVIPTIQSVHIVAIGVVVTSVFMIDLRIFGWAGRDQTLLQTAQRFASWLWGSLAVLLATGALMVVGEPERELMSLSFWLKMGMILVGATFAIVFLTKLRRDQTPNKGLAVVTLFVWFSIIVLGRLIAYDNVWGSWSMHPRL
jgi:hypothetical protein